MKYDNRWYNFDQFFSNLKTAKNVLPIPRLRFSIITRCETTGHAMCIHDKTLLDADEALISSPGQALAAVS